MRRPNRLAPQLAAMMALVVGFVPAGMVAAEDLLTVSLKGRIYAVGETDEEPLFTFRRRVEMDGPRLHVTRNYRRPDGTLVARERVLYEDRTLVRMELEQRQTNASGEAVIRPGDNGRRQIAFTYQKGPGADPQTATEPYREPTLVADNLVPFMFEHWQALMRGEEVRFRFISIPRLETVSFELARDKRTTWRGQPAVRVAMDPANFFISLFVDTIYLTVLPEERRVVQYTGRTTPKLPADGGWEDLRAVTVYDYSPSGP